MPAGAGAVGSAGSGAWLIEVLRSAQALQAETMEKIVAMTAEEKLASDRMEIAESIVDTYA